MDQAALDKAGSLPGMTYTPLASEKPWQPPLPADPLFVERCRANLKQARMECLILIRENAKPLSLEIRKTSPRRLRKRGGTGRGRQRYMTDAQIRQFHLLYLRGMTYREIMSPVWREIGFLNLNCAAAALSDGFAYLDLKRRGHKRRNPEQT